MKLSRELEEFFPPPLWRLVEKAGGVAAARGWPAYLVGGVVRDMLLHRPNLDIDLAVEGKAVEVAREVGGAKLISHPRFGTAKLQGPGWSIDFTTVRRESYPYPGALPVVAPGTIQDDLFRRDFTINAMAISLSPAGFGQLLDPFGGREDLAQGRLRLLHPSSFVDDATRILRGIRYEQRFGFQFESETLRLLHQHRDMLDTISGDRLRREVELMLSEEFPERALGRAVELKVLAKLGLPLNGDSWLSQKFAQARAAGQATTTLYLCLLVYPLDSPEVEGFLRRLNFPPRTARSLRDTVRLKQALPTLPPSPPPSQVVRWLEGYSPTAVAAAAIATPLPEAARLLKAFLARWRYLKPRLGGKELKALGVPSGPPMREMLWALRQARLDGNIKSQPEEVALVCRWLSQQAGQQWRQAN